MTTTPAALPAATADAQARSRGRAVLAQLAGNNAARLSALVLLAVGICAAFPGLIAPHDPMAQDLSRRLMQPVFLDRSLPEYLLGTDQLGRDLLSRIIYGARVTFLVCVPAVAVAAVVGIVAGLFAGYYGGRVDSIVVRLIDMHLAFPIVLLVLVAVAVVGPSLVNVIIIMGLSGWPRFARIVRGQVLSVKEQEFVEAARSVGATGRRIMFSDILPNITSALIVYASFELARMILLEATLSFLGLGVQPPTPSWGGMINDGRPYLQISWAVSVFPGIAIAVTILAVNMLGDELRDALDPQLSQD